MERSIAYFNYCGEINTEALLQLVRKRFEIGGVDGIVIASETGRSALKAMEIFDGLKVKIIVVTHYPAETWGPSGSIPIGLKRKEYVENLRKLEDYGCRIVQGTRPFAPPSRHIDWGYPTPEAIMDKTLEIFGSGMKIAIEVSLMATDAGELNEGENVISCAGTYKGLDTAILVKTSYTMNFFKSFEVREIIAKPWIRVLELPEYTFEGWRGDLEGYYKQFRRN
ncbi:MAG: pyruvate kinase alpha/beta domain-containing protein [Candidatus Methanomethylicia archaeon]